MQRGLGGTAFEPIEEGRDRELTLGPSTLALLGLGLFAVCGLSFVFGYAMGHRNAESGGAASAPSTGIASILQPAKPPSKPSAGQTGAQSPPPAAAADSPASSESDSAAAATEPVRTPVPPTPTAAPPATSASPVHAALAGQTGAAPSVPAAGNVQSALAQPAGIMVQIAAVSHPEDADVLVGALRKRGYAVTAHRDPADGLLHVQIGPFANRNDAFVMRQKLLNDGYNATVP
jgi:DedD protein